MYVWYSSGGVKCYDYEEYTYWRMIEITNKMHALIWRQTNRLNKNVQQAEKLTQKNVQETLPDEVYELTTIQM